MVVEPLWLRWLSLLWSLSSVFWQGNFNTLAGHVREWCVLLKVTCATSLGGVLFGIARVLCREWREHPRSCSTFIITAHCCEWRGCPAGWPGDGTVCNLMHALHLSVSGCDVVSAWEVSYLGLLRLSRWACPHFIFIFRMWQQCVRCWEWRESFSDHAGWCLRFGRVNRWWCEWFWAT